VCANPKCIYWLSPNAFISHGYDHRWLTEVTTDKQNFPQFYFGVKVTSTRNEYYIWATMEIEAFRTLYEMTMYRDFHLLFDEIWHNPERHNSEMSIKLPTLLLKRLLEKTRNRVTFGNIVFLSASAGRVLALSGQNSSIFLEQCVLQPPAEEAFLDAMLSKTDKNIGLSHLYIHTFPFNSGEVMGRLIRGSALKSFSYLPDGDPYPEEMLNSLCNSGLLSLELFSVNFTSHDAYGAFLRSLHSSSLEQLTINEWDFRRLAFPVEIVEKLSLVHLSMTDVSFHEGGWKSFFRELPKCKTLRSLEFMYSMWWDSEENEKAAGQFAVEFAQFLKNSPNILSINKTGYCLCRHGSAENDNDDLYATCFAPILEHNRLKKNLETLKNKENYEVRGFLVSEALGTRFAENPSSCYTMLKVNVDVLISCLLSEH